MDQVEMNTGVARDTAARLESLKNSLEAIESAHLGPIVALARDEEIVGALRQTAGDLGSRAYETANYLTGKADDLETIANAGWNSTIADLGATGALAAADLSAATIGANIGAAAATWLGPPIVEGKSGKTVPSRNPAFKDWPRLADALGAGGEVDEELEKLAEELAAQAKKAEEARAKGDKDKFAEWYWEQYNDAVQSADPEKMKILAAGLWDYLEKLQKSKGRGGGEDGVKKFWEDFARHQSVFTGVTTDGQESLAVLMAAGGLPEVPYIVSKAMRQYDGLGNSFNSSYVSGILEALGHPLPDPETGPEGYPDPDSKDPFFDNATKDWYNRQKWYDSLVAENLSDLGKTKSGRGVIVDSFNRDPGGSPMVYAGKTNQALERLGQTYPDFLSDILTHGDQDFWAQRFADQMAISGYTEAERKEAEAFAHNFYALLMDQAARQGYGGTIGAQEMEALAQIDRGLAQAGRNAITIDPMVIVSILAGFIPGAGGKVAGVLLKAQKLVGKDGLLGERKDDQDIKNHCNNLALLVLAQEAEQNKGTDTAGSQITTWFENEKRGDPLTADDWADFEEAAKDEIKAADAAEKAGKPRPPTPLGDALERHTATADAMEKAYVDLKR